MKSTPFLREHQFSGLLCRRHPRLLLPHQYDRNGDDRNGGDFDARIEGIVVRALALRRGADLAGVFSRADAVDGADLVPIGLPVGEAGFVAGRSGERGDQCESPVGGRGPPWRR